jgi:hypothetical protein
LSVYDRSSSGSLGAPLWRAQRPRGFTLPSVDLVDQLKTDVEAAARKTPAGP